jgi:pSer/pThr/pTyr-binding forkhead associated (FHA) protein
VCLEGPERGRDYRLHGEKNFIGRDPGMDIRIAGDDAISRQRHAVVTYEPKRKTFWLQPGDAAGLVYLNQELVNTPMQIYADDVIELGGSKLVLVPFQSAKRSW